MKKILTCIIIVLLPMFTLAQESPITAIERANQAYNDGNYVDAVDLYRSVIDEGYASAELYYNLGNAYFKSNDIPSAILFYEKALKLDPKDEQIKFNLRIANSQITDKIEAVPDMFYVSWWKSFSELLSPDSWARVTIAFFLGCLILAAVFIMTSSLSIRRTAFWAGLLVIFLLIISLTIAYQGYNHQIKDQYGIIFTPTITVKSAPAKTSVDLFVIHEGTKVEIMDRIEGWFEIRIANGSVGWLPEETLKKI